MFATPSVREVAALLGCSQATVRHFVASGKLNRVKGLRHLRITLPSLCRATELTVPELLIQMGMVGVGAPCKSPAPSNTHAACGEAEGSAP
jgi:excisionase family DNA binding protein